MHDLLPAGHLDAANATSYLEKAIQMTGDGVFLIDENARICFVNDAACLSLGYTREELLGMTVPDIDPLVTLEDVVHFVTHRVNHATRRAETCHRTKDGSLRQVELSSTAVRIGDQHMCMSVARDITQRKRLEKTLHFIAQADNSVEYLPALADYLAQALACELVLIADLTGKPGWAQTRVALHQGVQLPTLRYPLSGTPGEDVLNHHACCHPQGVQALFPGDQMLADLGLTAYAGITLRDSAGHPIGMIGVASARAFKHTDPITQTLLWVAPRAAAELEREQHLAQLKSSEARYRSLAEASSDNIVHYGLDLRVRYANAQFERFIGLDSATLCGRRPQEVWPDGRFDNIEQMVAQVIQTGRPAELTVLLPGEGRSPRVHHVRAAPERNATGALVGVVLYGSDVTATQETARRLRHFVDNLPGVTFTYCTRPGQAAGFTYLSQSVDAYFGITPTQGLDDPERVLAALQPEDRAALEAMLSHTHTAAQSLEVRTLQPGRPTMWLDVRLACERLQDGTVVWNGLMLDVTERKRMTDQVAAARDFLDRVIDGIADPVFVKDRQHRWQMVNQAFVDFTGIPRQTLIGQSDDAFFPAEQVQVFWHQDTQVFTTGQDSIHEEEVTPLQGVTRSVQTKKSLIHTAEGEALLVGVIRDITDLRTYRQRIHDLAYVDTLTQLSNRSHFLERAGQVFQEASAGGHQVGLIMLDVDHFKRVNDTLGHHVGDRLLRKVASRLTRSIQTCDVMARLSGDEFAILLTHNRDDLGAVVRGILESVSRPMDLHGQEMVVSCSAGIAVFPDDGTQLPDLMKFADTAMYQAKLRGRNTFCFYSQDHHAESLEQLLLEADLRKALARGQLELHYQPKVRLEDRSICGCEALLRWKHPTKGMVPPNRFIGIAEELGLIVSIGEWVLRTAFETACAWNRPGLPPHTVAVNLSVRQFRDNTLVDVIRCALADTGCQAQWIELEITESLLLDGATEVQQTLEALRDLGFSIAIDDFGTGYSALSYLERFPIDVLKIDQSFIRNTSNAGYRAELVKAIISLAHALSLTVVAEGVEEQVQHDFLRTNRCQMAQGYAYGKPVPRPQFECLYLPQDFPTTSPHADT